jgi:putative aminopeptidase FrvX
MAIPPVLRSLLSAHGPSGYETAPAAVFRDAAAAHADVTTDVMGSVWARVPGTAGGPTLAVVGHIDEIGVIVTHIDDEGFLRFMGVGGWDPQILVGQRLSVATRDGAVAGVVGRKPIHLLKDDDRKKVARLDELHIDVGAKDGDEARRLVRVGDVAVIEGEPVELPNGRAVARSMDNRLGCYVAYEVARLVREAGGAPGDVVAVAAVQEETSFGGSTTTAYSLRPDLAIVVDVTHATDAPGVDAGELGEHGLGSGPVVTRGAVVSRPLNDLIDAAAESVGIECTTEAAGSSTRTDADSIHLSRTGVATAVVSIPLRYMHSPVELVELADVEATIDVIAAMALRLEADQALARW